MGFRKGLSCVNSIFTLITTIQLQLRLSEREIYAIFVDFKRAFDIIPHQPLWKKLYLLEVSPRFIRIVKALYDQATIQVKNYGA